MKKIREKKLSTPSVVVRPYKILHCPLFRHMKHTDACIALRAKRVCKVNCKDFFEWANQNEETVKAVVTKHEASIQDYIKSHSTLVATSGSKRSGVLVQSSTLLENVMPKGENICEYCGKAFKFEARLKTHQKKKHRRQVSGMVEKKTQLRC